MTQGLKKNNRIRILIITYHFPPLDVISSYRTYSFARYLPEHGIEPTILTHFWENENNKNIKSNQKNSYKWQPNGTKIAIEENDEYKVIRIPRIKTISQKIIDIFISIPIIRTLISLLLRLSGIFNPHIIYSHQLFKKHLTNHLKDTKYDFIMVSISPDEHLKLAAWIESKYNIPFICDYRDTYDNRILSPDFNPNIKTKINLLIREFYHKKWMKKCSLLISVSKILVAKLLEKTGTRQALEIRNGYDPDRLDQSMEKIDKKYFNITYAGRIYPDQNIEPFVLALRRFIEQIGPSGSSLLRINFQGIVDSEAFTYLKKTIPNGILHVEKERIPSDKMYDKISKSSILFIMSYNKPGVYSGKLMDYVGSYRNILMIPSDNGVISEFIKNGELGLSTNDVEKASAFLIEKFMEWKKYGQPIYHGDKEFISKSSRKYQAALLANGIKELINR